MIIFSEVRIHQIVLILKGLLFLSFVAQLFIFIWNFLIAIPFWTIPVSYKPLVMNAAIVLLGGSVTSLTAFIGLQVRAHWSVLIMLLLASFGLVRSVIALFLHKTSVEVIVFAFVIAFFEIYFFTREEVRAYFGK